MMRSFMARIRCSVRLFFDKNQKKYVVLDSDSVLLGAFDMYWDIRRLPIQVHVKDIGPRLLDVSSKAS